MKGLFVRFKKRNKNKNMLAVNGIYDGKTVRITDKLTEKKKYKVVVTFIKELFPNEQEIRNFT